MKMWATMKMPVFLPLLLSFLILLSPLLPPPVFLPPLLRSFCSYYCFSQFSYPLPFFGLSIPIAAFFDPLNPITASPGPLTPYFITFSSAIATDTFVFICSGAFVLICFPPFFFLTCYTIFISSSPKRVFRSILLLLKDDYTVQRPRFFPFFIILDIYFTDIKIDIITCLNDLSLFILYKNHQSKHNNIILISKLWIKK